MLKIRFNQNYLGGKVKFWKGTFPAHLPGYVLDLEGFLGVVLSVPSKLCAFALAHSFQWLRTRINLLRTDILLNRHIAAHELFHKYYKY